MAECSLWRDVLGVSVKMFFFIKKKNYSVRMMCIRMGRTSTGRNFFNLEYFAHTHQLEQSINQNVCEHDWGVIQVVFIIGKFIFVHWCIFLRTIQKKKTVFLIFAYKNNIRKLHHKYIWHIYDLIKMFYYLLRTIKYIPI